MVDSYSFVTGAGNGIGREIAKRYAAEGSFVGIADLHLESSRQTREEIGKEFGQEAYDRTKIYGFDVTDENCLNDAVSDFANGRRIDTMVCNAGIQHICPVHELSLEQWRKVTAVHLDASFLCTKVALKYMYSQGKGAIIYIGSVHSKTASPLKAPYVAAKHGVLGLCRTVAKEGGPKGVRANVICPGYVLTDLVKNQIKPQADKLGITEEEVVKNVFLKDTVDGEFTTVEDIADLAVLFSAASTNALTGQSIISSHGWFME